MLLRGSKASRTVLGKQRFSLPCREGGPLAWEAEAHSQHQGCRYPELSGHWQMVAMATGHWKASRRITVNEVPQQVFPLRQRNGLGAAGLPGSASRTEPWNWPSGPAPAGTAVPRASDTKVPAARHLATTAVVQRPWALSCLLL